MTEHFFTTRVLRRGNLEGCNTPNNLGLQNLVPYFLLSPKYAPRIFALFLGFPCRRNSCSLRAGRAIPQVQYKFRWNSTKCSKRQLFFPSAINRTGSYSSRSSCISPNIVSTAEGLDCKVNNPAFAIVSGRTAEFMFPLESSTSLTIYITAGVGVAAFCLLCLLVAKRGSFFQEGKICKMKLLKTLQSLHPKYLKYLSAQLGCNNTYQIYLQDQQIWWRCYHCKQGIPWEPIICRFVTQV